MSKIVNLVIYQVLMEKLTSRELSDILKLFPEDTKIVDMSFSEMRRVIRLESNNFKSTLEANLLPEVYVKMKYGYDSMGMAIEYFGVDEFELADCLDIPQVFVPPGFDYNILVTSNSEVYGTGIWDYSVSNSTTAVQLYNPLTGNFDEYEGPTSELLEINNPPVKSGERICCGATPKWVDNGIGFQYHLCKTCGKEVE